MFDTSLSKWHPNGDSGSINVPDSAESGKRLGDKEEHHREDSGKAPGDLQHGAMYADICVAAVMLVTPAFKLFIYSNRWVAQLQFTVRLLGGAWAEPGGRGPSAESLS